jgi:hypothetical protein
VNLVLSGSCRCAPLALALLLRPSYNNNASQHTFLAAYVVVVANHDGDCVNIVLLSSSSLEIEPLYGVRAVTLAHALSSSSAGSNAEGVRALDLSLPFRRER